MIDVNSSLTIDIDVAGAACAELRFSQAGAGTVVNLNNDLDCGKLSLPSNTDDEITFNGGNCLVGGDLNMGPNLGIQGTGAIVLDGTGTWDGFAEVLCDLVINTAGTITVSGTVRFGASTITYVSGTVVASGSTLVFSSPCTIDTNGITWNNVSFQSTAATWTVSSQLDIGGSFSQVSGSAQVFNGSDIYISGNANWDGTTMSGTSDFVMIGTGTWSSNSAVTEVRNTVIFNAPSGTITISGTVNFGGVFTHSAGTIVTTGSTVNFRTGATVTANTITFNNVGFGTGTHTLSGGTYTVNGSLSYLNNATITVNGSAINAAGSLSLLASSLAAGSSVITLNGTGTWSGGTVRNNLVINTSGTITISGSVGYNTGTLTYTAGIVVTTGSTLVVTTVDTTLNTAGIVWNNLDINGNNLDITLSNVMTVNGNFTSSNSNQTINGSDLIVNGNITLGSINSGTLSGTSTIKMQGTGTLTCNANLGIAVVVNGGTVTLGTSVNISGGSISLSSGTVNPGANTTVAVTTSPGTVTLNLPGIRIPNLTSIAATWTLLSPIVVGNMTVSGTSTVTFNGSGLEINKSMSVGTGTINGTSAVKLSGTCLWTASGGSLRSNTTISTREKITISGSVSFSSATLTYLSGAVDASSGTLVVANAAPSVFVNINNIQFSGVVFESGASASFNRFFEGRGNLPCAIRPSTVGNFNVTMTAPNMSEFISIQNVVVSSSSPYKLHVSTINSNKGGNSGVVYMAQQLSSGLPNEYRYKSQRGMNGYVRNFGNTSHGLVRNS